MLESFKRKFEKAMNNARGEVTPMNSTVSEVKDFHKRKELIEKENDDYFNKRNVA